MKVKQYLINLYYSIQSKRIEKELKNINWESEYGLTHARMKEIKERIYKKLVEQIRIYEEEKQNG